MTLTYREQTHVRKVHRLKISPPLVPLRHMEDSRTDQPQRKSSRRRHSQSDPLAISLSTILDQSHCLEFLLSLLSSIGVALNKLHALETADPDSLPSIANAIDGSKALLLHHSGGDLLLAAFED